MTATTRAPLTPLQTALLRQQSANREYRRHLIEDDCAELSWCQTREELDTAASIADHEYARLLTGVR